MRERHTHTQSHGEGLYKCKIKRKSERGNRKRAREMKKVTTSGTTHPCNGLPGGFAPATWNYSTRRRLGGLLSEASGLADICCQEKNKTKNGRIQ